MDSETLKRFENVASGHKECLIEAARRDGKDADVIWVNMCSIYGIKGVEAWYLRDHIRSQPTAK